MWSFFYKINNDCNYINANFWECQQGSFKEHGQLEDDVNSEG